MQPHEQSTLAEDQGPIQYYVLEGLFPLTHVFALNLALGTLIHLYQDEQRQQGISYRTALRWWKAGLIKGYQATTGTIIVTEEPPKEAHAVQRVAIYARVSSHEHRANLERQVERLEDYCAARGYQIATAVKEIASGVNDAHPKFLALLSDPSITTIVVEQQDRATRFGFRYLETLLGLAGRRIEVVNLAENDREDLLADLVSIVYSFAARL